MPNLLGFFWDWRKSVFMDGTLVRRGRIIDVSRLLSRLPRRTPTGIDRVEFAYARHCLGGGLVDGARALVTTPFNTGLLSRKTASRLIKVAEERWGESSIRQQSELWSELVSILRSPIWVKQRRILKANGRAGHRTDVAARAISRRAYAEATMGGIFGRRPEANRGDWYLHVSHINLHDPARLSWMKTRAERASRNMFLVHDLIPLSHPEYFLPGEAARHRVRMETVARHADVVIFNSRATQAAWDDFVVEHRLPRPHGAVVSLGTEDAFRKQDASFHSDVPYFIVVGTLESRKNLSFLLHVWKAWVQSSAEPHARLVVIGRRGRHSENTTDLIDRSAMLEASVVEVSELDDAGLSVLLGGARALLAPSLIEGFGLPIAEALSLGVPVIASDIPAHREVGGDCAEYLDPLDGPAWFQALDDYARPSSTRRDAMQHARLGYRAVTWKEHLESVENILADQS